MQYVRFSSGAIWDLNFFLYVLLTVDALRSISRGAYWFVRILEVVLRKVSCCCVMSLYSVGATPRSRAWVFTLNNYDDFYVFFCSCQVGGVGPLVYLPCESLYVNPGAMLPCCG